MLCQAIRVDAKQEFHLILKFLYSSTSLNVQKPQVKCSTNLSMLMHIVFLYNKYLVFTTIPQMIVIIMESGLLHVIQNYRKQKKH